MPLSALHRHLVRRIFSRLAASPDHSTLLFYQRLFALNPHLEAVYDIGALEQQCQLMPTLALAVKFMEQPVAANDWARDLRRCNLNQVGEPQFQQALLSMVEKQLGDDFTNGMRLAWIQFCEWLAHLLLANPDLDEGRT